MWWNLSALRIFGQSDKTPIDNDGWVAISPDCCSALTEEVNPVRENACLIPGETKQEEEEREGAGKVEKLWNCWNAITSSSAP